MEQSLARLQTDYIDLYITHWQDSTTPVSETMDALLDRLLEALALDGPFDAVTLESDGRSVPLPLAVRRAAGALAAGELLAAGERRLRALPVALGGHVIPEAVWRRDDPDGRTLRDIDTPADYRDLLLRARE